MDQIILCRVAQRQEKGARLQLGHGDELEGHEVLGPELGLVYSEQGEVADDALAQHTRAPLLRVPRPPHVHRRRVHDLRGAGFCCYPQLS